MVARLTATLCRTAFQVVQLIQRNTKTGPVRTLSGIANKRPQERMKKPPRKTLLALACLAALGAHAQESTQDANLMVAMLPTIQVYASRSDTEVQDMALHTTVVTQEELQKSPAQTLDQLLREVPGMNFTGIPAAQTDPTAQQTKMRGLGNAKVLVLLDGVPIHDPFYLTTQWFKVPLSNIERVEIIRGGNSSLWGNMAVAGVVNIVSKRPHDDTGEASASIGTHGTSNLTVSKNFSLSESLSFNLALDRFHTDGYQQTPSDYLWRFPDKQPVRDTDTNFQFSAYFQPNASLKGYLRAGYHIHDQNISYVYGSNLQESPDFAAGLTQTFDETSSLAANAWAQYVRFEKYNGNSCYWQATGTHCPTSSAVTPAQINDEIVQYYSQYGSQRYREQGASLAYSKNLKSWFNSYQLGLDYRHLGAKDSEWFYSAPVSLANLQNFNSSTYGEGDQTFGGVFGQARIVPVDALEITASARYDDWHNTDRINTRTSATGILTGGPIADSDKSAVNPSLAARYDLSDQFALRGAAYKSFRAPGFNNLTRTFGTGNSTTIANPDLEPETLRGWEAGVDYHSAALRLSATYFLYNISDMIATYTVNANSPNKPPQVTVICGIVVNGAFSNCAGATAVKYYTNDQDGQSHGVELTGHWRVSDELTMDASYTHTETYLTSHGSVVTDPLGVQLVAVPKDVALVGATWRPMDKVRTYAEARYIGPMLIDTTSVPNTVFGQGGNVIFNASASYAWSKAIEVSATVVNLFDRDYSENAYTYNQPYNRTLSMPRSFSAGVKVRF
jgi:iron complex outermembrane receptor protein